MSAADLQAELQRVVGITGGRFTRQDITSVIARAYAVRDLPDGAILFVTVPVDDVFGRGWFGAISAWKKRDHGLVLTYSFGEQNGDPHVEEFELYPLGRASDSLKADIASVTTSFQDVAARYSVRP